MNSWLMPVVIMMSLGGTPQEKVEPPVECKVFVSKPVAQYVTLYGEDCEGK